jgi:hypothetical protein
LALHLELADLLSAGLIVAQPKPADCNKGRAPEKVEGQVVRVDAVAGIVTVREKDGTVHEFQAPKETLQNLKAGDQIEAPSWRRSSEGSESAVVAQRASVLRRTVASLRLSRPGWRRVPRPGPCSG